MTAWTNDELKMIGTAEELQLASLRHDGTLRKPVIIWVVRVGDELYVRSYKGRDSGWFKGVQVRHEGRISAGGIDTEVTFAEETNPAVNDQVDAAYRSKYRRYSRLVPLMLTPEVRATTIKLVPVGR